MRVKAVKKGGRFQPTTVKYHWPIKPKKKWFECKRLRNKKGRFAKSDK